MKASKSVACIFVLFIWISWGANSRDITFVGDTFPKYIHLALTGETTEMVIGWYTNGIIF
jgi:hypothetical protein